MAKPFDATTKQLIEMGPRDWIALAGFAVIGEVRVIDADAATVTAEADRVLLASEPPPGIYHTELQSSRDDDMERRLLRYNVLLEHNHRVPVRSIVVLLRPEADAPSLTGHLERQDTAGRVYLTFAYSVVRVWEMPVAEILAGGLATLPLAPLARVRRGDLPGVVRRMDERITAEASPDTAKTLWASTYILLGLRYAAPFAAELLKGVRQMRESTTYQAILQEGREAGRAEGREAGRAEGREAGRAEGAENAVRETLLRVGRRRYGPAPDAVVRALNAVHSVERLEQMAERLLEAESWEELVQEGGAA